MATSGQELNCVIYYAGNEFRTSRDGAEQVAKAVEEAIDEGRSKSIRVVNGGSAVLFVVGPGIPVGVVMLGG